MVMTGKKSKCCLELEHPYRECSWRGPCHVRIEESPRLQCFLSLPERVAARASAPSRMELSPFLPERAQESSLLHPCPILCRETEPSLQPPRRLPSDVHH